MTDAESSNPDYVDVSVVLKAMLHEGVPMTVAKHVMALLQDDNFATPPTAQRHDVSEDAEKWGQQYRCGCFLGFPTKRAIPTSCPQHMRDKQGGALPLDATPPTAQRHDEAKPASPNDCRDVSAVIRHGLFFYEVDFGDEGKGCYVRLYDFNRVVEKLEKAAHGAGAAVEAVAWVVEREHDPTFPRLFTTESAADSWVRYVELPPFATKRPLIYGDTKQRSEQVAGGGGVDALRKLAQQFRRDAVVCDGDGYKVAAIVKLDCANRIEAALSTQPLLSDQPGSVVVDKAVGDSPIALLTVKPTPSGHGLTGDVQLNDFPSRAGDYDLFLCAPALAHDLAEVVEDLEKHRDECHDRTHWNTYEHCISRIRNLAAKPAALHPEQAKDGAAR